MKLNTIQNSIRNRQRIVDDVKLLLRENKAVIPVHSTSSGLGPGILFKEIKDALKQETQAVEKFESGELKIRKLWQIQYYGCTNIRPGLLFHRKRNLIDHEIMHQIIKAMDAYKEELGLCYSSINYYSDRIKHLGKPYWW